MMAPMTAPSRSSFGLERSSRTSRFYQRRLELCERNFSDRIGFNLVTAPLSRWGLIQPFITASPTSREVGLCRQEA